MRCPICNAEQDMLSVSIQFNCRCGMIDYIKEIGRLKETISRALEHLLPDMGFNNYVKSILEGKA